MRLERRRGAGAAARASALARPYLAEKKARLSKGLYKLLRSSLYNPFVLAEVKRALQLLINHYG